jgi:hypothetical protein
VGQAKRTPSSAFQDRNLANPEAIMRIEMPLRLRLYAIGAIAGCRRAVRASPTGRCAGLEKTAKIPTQRPN